MITRKKQLLVKFATSLLIDPITPKVQQEYYWKWFGHAVIPAQHTWKATPIDIDELRAHTIVSMNYWPQSWGHHGQVLPKTELQ